MVSLKIRPYLLLVLLR